MATFDYVSAKKAGHSDQDIATYLGQKKSQGIDLTIDQSAIDSFKKGGVNDPGLVPNTPTQAKIQGKPMTSIPGVGSIALNSLGSGLAATGKAALNTPVSAAKTVWNMTGGTAGQVAGMVGQTLQNIPKLPGQIADVAGRLGEVPGALKSIAPIAGQGLMEQIKGISPALTALFQGDTQTAGDLLTKDPFGQVAMPVLLALGAEDAKANAGDAKIANSPESSTAKIGDLKPTARPMEAAIGKIGKPIVDITGKALGAAAEKAGGLAKSGVGAATKLSPETVDTVIKGAGKVSDAIARGVTRDTTGAKVLGIIKDRIAALSDTGKEYQAIRDLPIEKAHVSVPSNLVDDFFAKKNIQFDENGKIIMDMDTPPMGAGDIKDIEDFRKQFGRGGDLTGNQFLNARKTLDGMADYDVTKKGVSNILGQDLRAQFDALGKKQLPGLKELDAKYAPEVKDLKQVKKDWFDAKTGELKDSAINKIAAAIGKGKTGILARLEKLSPGITEDIRIVKAIEDLKAAKDKHVQGVSGKMLEAGGAAVGAALGGPQGAAEGLAAGAIIDVGRMILTEPTNVMRMLETYGRAKNFGVGVLDAIKSKIQSGQPLSPHENTIVEMAVKSEAPKAKSSGKVPPKSK